jgi:hypothetical protein
MAVYAGIGSRETPEDVLALIRTAAASLSARGHLLRSGHAPGADQAFELGAGSNAEIYLPWASFEARAPLTARYVQRSPTSEALALAAQHHPGWLHLTQGGRALHARNCHQILGRDLNSPVRFVLCWTPDGSLDGRGRKTGGTGQALRIANALKIEVFNLARDDHRARVEALTEGSLV